MYQLHNISKKFKEQTILDNVSLEITENEIISIMGKSGAGKSTLLGILAGLTKADSGEIRFQDKEISSMDEEGLAEFRLKNIGYIFQDFKLIPSLTVFDNILLGIYPRRDIPHREKHRSIEDIASKVGLGGKLHSKVDTLSGGEKQRVAIARCLVKNPAVILADEPTGNLDSKTADSIMDLFDTLHQDLSTTFLIVTHDKDLAARTQKTYHLHDGVLRHENA